MADYPRAVELNNYRQMKYVILDVRTKKKWEKGFLYHRLKILIILRVQAFIYELSR
jgi:hypothetical protein